MDEKFTAKCYTNTNDSNIKACVDSFLSKFEVGRVILLSGNSSVNPFARPPNNLSVIKN